MKKFYYLSVLAIATVVSLFFLKKQGDNTIKRHFEYQLALAEKAKGLSYEEIQNLPKQDRPDLAALQHFEMTKDPSLGYPPVERKVEAFEELLTQYKNNPTSRPGIPGVKWDERGPNNVGGRTRALMFDPNDATNKKVWAGAISGGLWVNQDITDPNSGWTNINDFMASLSIATLTHDPNNKQIFYLGTGERYTRDFAGLGIWKSTNGGSSWTRLANTSSFSYVPKMVVTNSSTIIAATRGGIKRSTDGGTTWTSPATATVDMADLELAANGDLYAGDFSGRVHKSTDDGLTWTSVSPSSGGQRVEIGISPASNTTLYAMSASGRNVAWLAKSTDGGTNWSNLNIPKYTTQRCAPSTSDFTRGQAWYDLIIGVHPTNADIAVIGGIDLYRTTNGGTSWGLVSYWTGACDTYVHADQHAITFRPGHPNEAIFGNDGGVAYSSNIGNAPNPSFIIRNKDYNVTQFYAGAMVNDVKATEFIAGSQDNGTQRFVSAGINATTEATGGDGAFCHIDQDNPNYWISSYVYSTYYLSSDRGTSFTTINNDRSNIGRFINPTEYDSKAKILYGAAGNGQISRIKNITTSPSPIELISVAIDGGEISTIKASPYTDNVIFVGTGSGSIYKITNAHTTPVVTNITGTFDTAKGIYLSSIDVGASDDQLLITYSNYGVNSVFESTNGGTNWKNKEGNLSDIPVYSVLYNPKKREEVLIATELGVWSTTNINAPTVTWEATNMGLANVSTRMLKYRSSDGMILAATHGRGLFTTASFAPSFVAHMTASSSAYTGSPVSFTNSSIGAVTNSSWDFGDGYTSTDANPSHTYALPGKYTVVLKINNGRSEYKKSIRIFQSRSIPYLAANGGNFESNTEDFFAENLTGTKFELGSSSIAKKDGTASGSKAWVTGLTDAQYADNSKAYLYSPGYDFSAAGTYSLSFKTKYSFEANWDGFIIEYSSDAGKTWNKLGNAIEANWYNQTSDRRAIWGAQVPIFSGNTSGFVAKTKNVSFLAGNARVGFRIHFGTDAATTDVGMAIDDFEVNGPTTNPVPNFVSTKPQVCVGSTVTFNDNTKGTVSAYSWNFGVGASPSTASGPGPHRVTYATEGMSTVALTVTGGAGDVTETKNNYVKITPAFTVANTVKTNINDFIVCSGTEAIITVEGANTGVKYQLFNAGNDQAIGEIQVGANANLTFNTGKLNATTSFYFIVTNDINCTTRLAGPTLTAKGFQITQTGIVLKAIAGDSYQWYFNGKKIPRATNNTYKALSKGDYTCKVTKNGCEITSDVFTSTITSLDPLSIEGISLYPNPSMDGIIELTHRSNSKIIIYNSVGNVIYHNTSQGDYSQIDLSSHPAGLYVVQVTSNGKSYKKRLSIVR